MNNFCAAKVTVSLRKQNAGVRDFKKTEQNHPPNAAGEQVASFQSTGLISGAAKDNYDFGITVRIPTFAASKQNSNCKY